MKQCSHNSTYLIWIDEQMKRLGVLDYRFCIENDCYVCDKNGVFYSVCTRKLSRAGNQIERYAVRRLQGSIDKDGYQTYRISINGVRKHLKAHRLMLNAWIGEQPNLVVNHIDGNKFNNALSNLEWCTVAENNKHAIETGLFNPHFLKGRLKKIPSSEWMTIYLLHRYCGYSLSALGRMHNCKHGTIKKVIDKVDGILPREITNAG